jgi:hypothetical protein
METEDEQSNWPRDVERAIPGRSLLYQALRNIDVRARRDDTHSSASTLYLSHTLISLSEPRISGG